MTCYADFCMELERAEETFRLMRAIRSLAYNRALQPLVEGRIERAEAKIRSHLMIHDLETTRIGQFQVVMDEEGDITLSRLPLDGDWQQMSLPRVVGSQMPTNP